MKIKIIKNDPPKTKISNYDDISKYTGEIFEVVDTIKYDIDGNPNNGVVIEINDSEMEIYQGEYEIVKMDLEQEKAINYLISIGFTPEMYRKYFNQR